MALVRHKWNNFGRYVYYTNLLLYLTFLICLTKYMVYTPAPYHAKDILQYTMSKKNVENQTLIDLLQKEISEFGFDRAGNCEIVCKLVTIERHTTVLVSKVIILVLAAIHIAKEIFQLAQVIFQILIR